MEYWVKRNLDAQEALMKKSEEEINKQLVRYYQKSMKSVMRDFESVYNKLLSLYKDDKTPTPADLFKLDSYWKAQEQLRAVLQRLGDKEVAAISKAFTQAYIVFYENVAMPSDKAFSTIDAKIAEQMINEIWCADGKTWSNRIWDNTNRLQQALNDNLIDCVVAGKKTTQLKKMLQETFGVSYSRSDTLVRTELAHIRTEASKRRYIDYGCREVEVFADKDERRCDVCGKLHRQRFPIGGKMPVPAHPNCRCCVLPVVE